MKIRLTQIIRVHEPDVLLKHVNANIEKNWGRSKDCMITDVPEAVEEAFVAGVCGPPRPPNGPQTWAPLDVGCEVLTWESVILPDPN